MTVVEHARDTTHPIPRPAYGQPKLIAFVFLGGALGASARLGLTLAMPSDAGDDWPVLIANLVGAFLLGLLLTGLASRKPERTWPYILTTWVAFIVAYYVRGLRRA
ncbi:hypothetical protein F6B41_03240 [Microbacterium lushaniae]|nr:hypothetical protein F6B41_03240 [Microbacterium lushaniae]